MKDHPIDARTSRDDATERPVTPFFARFLEVQREGDDPNLTNATLKYPSDRDEDIDPAV
jgi:hypothetical protein